MPYVEEMLSIGKAANGYVLTVRVPYKDDDDRDGNYPVHPESKEKVIICTDLADLTGKITSILPALSDKQTAEAKFDSAFKELESYE